MSEGISKDRITRVGNIMIDSLEMLRSTIENMDVPKKLNRKKGTYGLITLHRPSNVDNPKILERLCRVLNAVSGKLPLIFPVHPRTSDRLLKTGNMAILENNKAITLTTPLGYTEFMNLVMGSRLLITDSGGVQEETTYLGIPCLTLRSNTKRPVTVTQGTNRLCSPDTLSEMVDLALSGNFSKQNPPDGWPAARVADCIKKVLSGE